MKGTQVPEVFEIGKHNKKVPIKISVIKVSKIIFAAVILKNLFGARNLIIYSHTTTKNKYNQNHLPSISLKPHKKPIFLTKFL